MVCKHHLTSARLPQRKDREGWRLVRVLISNLQRNLSDQLWEKPTRGKEQVPGKEEVPGKEQVRKGGLPPLVPNSEHRGNWLGTSGGKPPFLTCSLLTLVLPESTPGLSQTPNGVRPGQILPPSLSYAAPLPHAKRSPIAESIAFPDSLLARN